ncbi:hypothetical protein HDU96_000695 [Phlyctochytrium bullatum]|nr:hypothetical protein HDU96_000695 [Phlyctochytrium bullatum]
MPRLSNKQSFLKLLRLLLRDSADEEWSYSYGSLRNDMDDLFDLYQQVQSSRYLVERVYVGTDAGRVGRVQQLLDGMNDESFLQFTRMDRGSFDELTRLLTATGRFDNESPHEQTAPWLQIAVALDRLGCSGNGMAVGRQAANYAFSRGSIINFTD